MPYRGTPIVSIDQLYHRTSMTFLSVIAMVEMAERFSVRLSSLISQYLLTLLPVLRYGSPTGFVPPLITDSCYSGSSVVFVSSHHIF